MVNPSKKLTKAEKIDYFSKFIADKIGSRKITDFSEAVKLVHEARKSFIEFYGKDVPGSFIRILLNQMGVERPQSESTLEKKKFIFDMLDENQAFRDSKRQTLKAVEEYFGEEIHDLIFNEIWDEYFSIERGIAKKNVDIFGQQALFGD